MKYRNKDTGVIVEAMKIEYSCQDILDFGDGLIRSIQSTGLLSREMDTFDIEIDREYTSPWHCICRTGDYLIKKDTSIFTLCEKEFKEQFETVEEENNNMKINLNDEVKVKLTDNALDILKKNHKALNRIILKNGGKPDKFPHKPDENGYYTFQLWHLFEDFGEHICCGCEMPFTDGEIIKVKKESKAVEADERTITKDTTNDKIAPNIDINVYGECENPEILANDIKEKVKKLFDPVENATETLKTDERTVRDCILDMMIQERANKLHDNCFLYLKERINELNKSISSGFTDNMESYKKYVGTLNKLRDIGCEDFMKIKEQELKEALGFRPDISNDHILYNIELVAKRAKEDSKCANE